LLIINLQYTIEPSFIISTTTIHTYEIAVFKNNCIRGSFQLQTILMIEFSHATCPL